MKDRIREIASLISNTLLMDKKTRMRLKSTTKLKNSKLGDVLLIGNGPSAKSLTESQVKLFQDNGGVVAVMNNFYRSDLALRISPDYYFLMDPDFWYPKFKWTSQDGALVANYIRIHESDLTIVQPANFPLIIPEWKNCIFIDGRSTKGLLRIARPDKPWGLPASVALYAISTLKFLGYRTIYFTGLDSNFVNFFYADDLNQVYNSPHGQHFYQVDREIKNALDQINPNEVIIPPFRHLADLNYAHGIFLRDFYWLAKDRCINVGNDRTNDSSPRACLLPENKQL
jgi:hypothetical protein